MIWIKRILFTLLFLLAVALGTGYYLFNKAVPTYEGQLELSILDEDVDVLFDNHGIPHINAQSAADGYKALGYLMASERLFQMEMLRRVGSGTLSEIIGDKGLKADLFFRTSGLPVTSRNHAAIFLKQGNPEHIIECQSFIVGINTFIDEGNLPIEFTLAGIEPLHFSIEDLYYTAGYMAYSFALAAQTDLLATELQQEHGYDWTVGLGLHGDVLPPFNQSCVDTIPDAGSIPNVLEELGIPVFTGSNAWALNSSKTTTGNAILCNDTHIGFGIPQVWYEADLSFGDFSFYGNFIPGVPYALVGHNLHHAWGLTMFENDDIDFYRIRESEEGYLFNDNEQRYTIRSEVIEIKDRSDTTIEVKETLHGPIMNGAIAALSTLPTVSMRWEYLLGENKLMEAFRGMAHATNLPDFETSLAYIHAPGLNVVYADTADHIGWWACARLPERPIGTDSKMIIYGADSSTYITSYRPFTSNPHCVDPESGFVSTANEQPITPDSLYIPGYYVPPARAMRIKEILNERNDWDVEGMKKMMLDVVNPFDAQLASGLKEILKKEQTWTDFEKGCLTLLDWDGSYDIANPSPVLFQPLQVALMRQGLKDEMSPSQFDRFCETHYMRRACVVAISNAQHPMWDVTTTSELETMEDHVVLVFKDVTSRLAQEYGNNPSSWKWGDMHRWQPTHPFGELPLIGGLLNSEEFPVYGGNETISQFGYTPTDKLHVKARFGAQMRIVIDMNSIADSWSVTPCGQSGHRLSPHYLDQSELYVNKQFRAQTMQPQESDANFKKLLLTAGN
jgi:penicillin G amidase